MLNSLKTITIAISLFAICVGGCEGKPSTQSSNETKSTENVAVPTSLFVDTEPQYALSVAKAKSTAKQGDKITIEARIGGRREPFVENRAIFFVADSSLLSCDQLHGDACKAPWDYCCESPDNLRKNMATIQVVDDAGKPLKLSLKNEHGLEPLKTIFVSGKVGQIDDAGNLVINAESIHIKKG